MCVCVFTVYCCGLSELMCYIRRVSRARVSRFKGPEVVVFSGHFHPISQPPPAMSTHTIHNRFLRARHAPLLNFTSRNRYYNNISLSTFIILYRHYNTHTHIIYAYISAQVRIYYTLILVCV